MGLMYNIECPLIMRVWSPSVFGLFAYIKPRRTQLVALRPHNELRRSNKASFLETARR